ncbi:MAG: barstar family protein [Acidimicrobiales bacterium]
MPPTTLGDDPILLTTASADDLDRWRNNLPGFHVGSIDGRRSRTEAGFFDEVSHAFSMPDHFGSNWDALFDTMTDLSWLDADGYVLLVEHAENLLADEARDRVEVMVSVLTEVAEEWEAGAGDGDESRMLVFRTVLHTDDDGGQTVVERVGSADLGDLTI